MNSRGKNLKPLKLPVTSFPLKPVKQTLLEERLLLAWEEGKLFDKLKKLRQTGPVFSLLDGPPYPTGPIDWTLFVNKTLKDIYLRWRWMKGYRVEFPIGWDCHGLPIELEVERELKKKSGAEISSEKLRKSCRDYAEKYSKIQKKEFIRSGILADWNRTYSTMSREYEAAVLIAVAELSERNLLYRQLRPAFWCPSCQTALSDFETVKFLRTSSTALLSFPLISDPTNISKEFQNREIDLIVFKKNLWLLPAVSALGVLQDENYSLIQKGRRLYLIGDRYLHKFKAELNFKNWRVSAQIPGKELIGMKCRNPLLHQSLPILPWTGKIPLDSTGFIPLTPGHNLQHFELYRDFSIEKISILSPDGKYLQSAGIWQGLKALETEGRFLYHLKRMEALLSSPLKTVTQPYPHCWRCHHPLISRLIPQWFIRWEPKIAELSFKELSSIPPNIKERLQKLLQNRSDWSISRQRVWGVPLPFFYCTRCDNPLFSAEWIKKTARILLKEGSSDFWFQYPAERLIQLLNLHSQPVRCPNCGNDKFTKSSEIIDVWFDSGIAALFLREFFSPHIESEWDQQVRIEPSETIPIQPITLPPTPPQQTKTQLHLQSDTTYFSVSTPFNRRDKVEKNPSIQFKSRYLFDICFESRKQLNGWFQSLFLSTVLLEGSLPYRQLLAHWDLEIPEKSLSPDSPFKCLPSQAIEKWGVEPLRLWAANLPWFQKFVPSDSKFLNLWNQQKKLRNIFRYLLGNLHGFTPPEPLPNFSNLNALDQIVLSEFQSMIESLERDFEKWNFRQIWNKFFSFFIELSRYYFPSIRNILYTYPEKSEIRLSVQTTLFIIASRGIVVIAPILPFFAEEFLLYLRREVAPNLPESVHLSDWPSTIIPVEREKRFWPIFRDFVRGLRGEISRFSSINRLKSHQLKIDVELYLEEYFSLCTFLNDELKYIFDVAEFNFRVGALDSEIGSHKKRLSPEAFSSFRGQRKIKPFAISIRESELATCRRCHRIIDSPEVGLCPQCR